MPYNAFLQTMVATHLARKSNLPEPVFDNFAYYETRWMSFSELGPFETYSFLYTACNDEQHFREWLEALKGTAFLQEAAAKYEAWLGSAQNTVNETITTTILSEEQFAFWEANGYLRVSGLVPDQYCDDVTGLICSALGVDVGQSATWYPNEPSWHGLMLQLYQHPAIAVIRNHPPLKQLFTELYGTSQLIANTEKVSYNPPETASWRFRHENIHWDIDPKQPVSLYIQGLIYLEDVPEERGPIKVIPGFQHQYENYIAGFPEFVEAQYAIKQHPGTVKVPGKKGDIVLWQHTLPHCATANRDKVPRFVQYISFTKI
ncbi:phytanoyl-CoA dioxygenase family protein [Chitinophaga sp. Hz27]|uniref:phytanoyl-CoA dioxygenase family protein n=1 Tax=Chitinophaga sp. Hz27 TaxID=3347169 RepID=UPI0035D841E5